MCGRAKLSTDFSQIRLVFRIPPERPTPNFAPTDPVPVVRFDAKERQRSLDVMRWGLVPFWAKDVKVGFANINAKAEGIENKPAFREAFRRRRCLVPVDNLGLSQTPGKLQEGGEPALVSDFIYFRETETDRQQLVLLPHRPGAHEIKALAQPQHGFKPPDRPPCRVEGLKAANSRHRLLDPKVVA
jgi:hypothetical protein